MSRSNKKIAAVAAVVVMSGVAVFGAVTPAAALSDGETAAIGLGAFAVGAVASSAMSGGGMSGGSHHHHVVYRDCYSVRQPRYNHWGDIVGYRRVRVCE